MTFLYVDFRIVHCVQLYIPCNHECPPARHNCMTQDQAEYGFPDASQVSLYKGNTINLAILWEMLKMLSLYMHTLPALFKQAEIQYVDKI
jgi:hypothetical protein